jgi:hypothetical protein
MDQSREPSKKKATTVVPIAKFMNKELTIKEADSKMLRDLKCQFVLRIDDSGVHPEVIIPKARHTTFKDKSITVTYYDYKAAIGFLGSISASAFAEAKDDESGELRAALISLIISGISDFTLTEKNIASESKVKKLGLYLLKSSLLAGYMERLPEGAAANTRAAEVRDDMIAYLRAVPEMVKKAIAEHGLEKINPDAPVVGQIPNWLHGKIVPFPLPKDLSEEVVVNTDLTKFVFGKQWTAGCYLSWDELHLAERGPYTTLAGIKEATTRMCKTLPQFSGIDPILPGGQPNLHNKYVKELLEKKRFSLPPDERVPFEASRDDRTDSMEPALAKVQLALRSLLKFRAGELENRVSARPFMAATNPSSSLELTINPEFNKTLAQVSSGKEQNEIKEQARKAMFPHITVHGYGGSTGYIYNQGWRVSTKDIDILDTVGAVVGLCFPKMEDEKQNAPSVPAEEQPADEAGKDLVVGPRALVKKGTSGVAPPRLPEKEKTLKLAPPWRASIKLPDSADVQKEAKRLKGLRKTKKDKISTTGQAFLGYLKMYNPIMDGESLKNLETSSSVPASLDAQIVAAKLFPAARTLAGAATRVKFIDPDPRSDSSDSE